jgi:phosphoglucosamine mutase
VVARGADVGFALDGDADRLIAVDATGDRRRRPGPRHPRARTARSSGPAGRLGRIGALERRAAGRVEAAGGEVVRTPVGDKYILEGMQVSGATSAARRSAT